MLYPKESYSENHNRLIGKEVFSVKLRDKILYYFHINSKMNGMINLIRNDKERGNRLAILEKPFARILFQAFLMSERDFMNDSIWDMLQLYDECNIIIKYDNAVYRQKFIENFVTLVKNVTLINIARAFDNRELKGPEGLVSIIIVRKAVVNVLQGNSSYSNFLNCIFERNENIKNILIKMSKQGIDKDRAYRTKLEIERVKAWEMIVFKLNAK